MMPTQQSMSELIDSFAFDDSDRHNHDVTKAAVDLHMEATGAGQFFFGRSELAAALAWLRWRVRTWTASKPGHEAFDDAVKAMAIAALGEFGVGV